MRWNELDECKKWFDVKEGGICVGKWMHFFND